MQKAESSRGFSAVQGILFVCSFGILLICITFVHSQDFPCHPYLTTAVNHLLELIPKIGDAFVIAGILALVVDQGLKLKLVEEVVRAASPSLIGRHLPEPIRLSLVRYLTLNFVRPQWEIQYEITPFSDCPGFIRLATRVKGIIVNYGDKTTKLPFNTGLDPSPIDGKYGSARLSRVSMSEEESADKIFDVVPDPGQLTYEQEVDIKPNVRYTSIVETTEYLPATYSQPLFTSTAVVHTIVSIRYDASQMDVRIELPSGENPEPRGEPNQWGCEWTLRTPLLPGQCILLYWTAKEHHSNIAPGA